MKTFICLFYYGRTEWECDWFILKILPNTIASQVGLVHQNVKSISSFKLFQTETVWIDSKPLETMHNACFEWNWCDSAWKKVQKWLSEQPSLSNCLKPEVTSLDDVIAGLTNQRPAFRCQIWNWPISGLWDVGPLAHFKFGRTSPLGQQ